MNEPFEKIEVFEPGSPEERCMWTCLNMAKDFKTNRKDHPQGVEATAFVFGADRQLVFVSLRHLLHPGVPDGKAQAAAAIKEIAREVRAHFWAVISDAYVYEFTPEVQEAARAEGLRITDFRSWSAATRLRFPVQRFDALVLIVESRAGSRTVRQFYTERDDQVTWGKLEVEGAGDPSGLFVGLLPESQA